MSRTPVPDAPASSGDGPSPAREASSTGSLGIGTEAAGPPAAASGRRSSGAAVRTASESGVRTDDWAACA